MKYLWEPLNGFAPNSYERRVWSLNRTSLNDKVKGQGRQGQKRGFRRISGIADLICDKFTYGRRVWSLARTSLKVKVNFGSLHAVCVWKNIFALVVIDFTGMLVACALCC